MIDQKQKAIKLIQSGQFKEAASICKRLVKAQPRDFEVRFLMGLAQFRNLAFSSARASFHAALRLNPSSASTLINLAVCEYELGKFEKAETLLNRAIQQAPHSITAHHELAKIYRSVGKYERALSSANTALENQSHSSALRMLRGELLFSLLDWSNAAEDFDFVFEHAPNNQEALRLLLIALARSGQHERLARLCNEFAHDRGRSGVRARLEVLTEFSESISGGGNYSESLAISNALLTILRVSNANSVREHDLAGLRDRITLAKISAAQFLMPPEDVETAIEAAIETAEDKVAFLRQKLAFLLNTGRRDESLILCEKMLSRGTPTAELYGTLSEIRVFTKNDPYISEMQDKLAQPFVSADERVILNFVLAKALRDAGKIVLSFKHLKQGNDSKHKILTRAATKQINRISRVRKSSANLPTTGELKISRSVSPRPIFIVGMPRSGTSLLEQILTQDDQVTGVGELSFLDLKVKSLFGDSDRAATHDELSVLGRHYLQYVSVLARGANIIVDKSPFNFMHIGFILTALPDSKIVHVYRDPRAVCWSNYKTLYHAGNVPVSYSFSDLSNFYHAYQNLMIHWERMFPGRIHHQCYEDLVAHPKQESQKLYDYCELKWAPDVTELNANPSQVRTVSRLQVRDKIYAGSSDDWRKYESFLQPLTRALGSKNVLRSNEVFEKSYLD